jgi:hypothetical protein
MVGGPLSNSAIKRGWWHGSQYEVHRAATHPTHNPNRPKGALERREAPPLPPPRSSSWIWHTQCHQLTFERIVYNIVVPPTRHCLLCVKPRPTMRLRPTRWPPTPLLHPPLMVCISTPSLFLLSVVLGVVDLDLELIHLHVLSDYPCRSTASGPVTFNSRSFGNRLLRASCCDHGFLYQLKPQFNPRLPI